MIDWDDAFDNAGYIASADQCFANWAAKAEAARAKFSSETDISYGEHPRETLDLFYPPLSKGLVVFIHGGYWHKLNKSYSSHLATGAIAQGWSAAIINYPLAPDARISAITQSIAKGIALAADKVDGPIRLAGHSAGGHLVLRMMCSDTPLSDGLQQRLARVLSISGAHDLRPITLTKLNDILGLTAEEAKRESPALSSPGPHIPVSLWVGAQERPEFLRQNRLMAEAWELKGVDVTTVYDPGQDHFSVIDSLEEPKGIMTQELLR